MRPSANQESSMQMNRPNKVAAKDQSVEGPAELSPAVERSLQTDETLSSGEQNSPPLEATAIQAAEPVVRLLKQEASPEKLAQATDQAAKRRRRRRLAWLSAAGLLMLVALSTLGG